MRWSLPEIQPISDHKIDFSSKTLWLGSCFSENIATIGVKHHFQFEQSTFGTLFHPNIISYILRQVIQNNEENSLVFERDNHWFTWLASSIFYAKSKNELVFNWQSEIERLHHHLKTTNFLFITLGTSYAYRLNEKDILVANCHKQPGHLFDKELLNLDQMKEDWTCLLSELITFNPSLKVVFTVSPVRHTRDGIVENTKSKARLHLLVEELQNYSSVQYFPAFEIMMDELRDYRFYNDDLIHPNQSAIDEIWSRFVLCYFTPKTIELLREVKRFNQFFNHRTLISSTQEEDSLILKKKQLELFLKRNPEIRW